MVGQYVDLAIAMPMVATGMTTKQALVHTDRLPTKMALVYTDRSRVRYLSIAAQRSPYVLLRT